MNGVSVRGGGGGRRLALELVGLGVEEEVNGTEVVRGDLEQPVGLDLEDIAHELLAGEDELVEENPLGADLEERGGRVDLDGVGVLDSPVAPALLKVGGVVEEAGAEALADVGVLLVVDSAEVGVVEVELHSLARLDELVSDVPGPLH